MSAFPNDLSQVRPQIWFAISLFAGVALVAIAAAESLRELLVLPVGLLLAGAILFRPFIGLLLITGFVQLDALANLLFSALPLSPFKILTLLSLGGVIINNYREPIQSRSGFDEPLFRVALMFGLAALISALYASDAGAAQTSLERYLGLTILLYLVLHLVQGREQVEWLLLAVVISTAISAAVVLFDWAIGGHLLSTHEAATTAQWSGVSRSSGASDYNPTTAAIMMLTGTCLALILFWRSPRWRWLTTTTALIGSLALLFSFARSAAVVYALMLCWMLFKIRHHRRAPAIFAVIFVLLISALPWLPADLWERLATLSNFDTDRSLWRRLSYQIIGWDLFTQHPLLGVGPGNFPYHFIDEAYRWMPGRYLIPRELHNTYLEVLTEIGLLGFSCFAAMLLLALRGLARTIRSVSDPLISHYAEALLFAYTAFLTASVFMPHEYNKYLWIFAGLAIAVTRLGRDAANSSALPQLAAREG